MVKIFYIFVIAVIGSLAAYDIDVGSVGSGVGTVIDGTATVVDGTFQASFSLTGSGTVVSGVGTVIGGTVTVVEGATDVISFNGEISLT